jgi:hypothetical protein
MMATITSNTALRNKKDEKKKERPGIQTAPGPSRLTNAVPPARQLYLCTPLLRDGRICFAGNSSNLSVI